MFSCDPQHRPKCERCWPVVLTNEHHVHFCRSVCLIATCFCFLWPSVHPLVVLLQLVFLVSSRLFLSCFDVFLHRALLLFAVKPYLKEVEGNHSLTPLSMSFYLCLSLISCTDIIIPPSSTHPPISNPHLHLGASWTEPISAPSLLRPVLLPLIRRPPHLSELSSFLLFFPIFTAQMRCCVQRRVCTFLIASSCPGIRWGKWACNETESTAVQTHTRRRVFFVCVSVNVCVRMHAHVGAHRGWLRSPCFSSHYFGHCPLYSLPVSLLQPLPASSVSYHLSLFMPPTVSRFVSLSYRPARCSVPSSMYLTSLFVHTLFGIKRCLYLRVHMCSMCVPFRPRHSSPSAHHHPPPCPLCATVPHA